MKTPWFLFVLGLGPLVSAGWTAPATSLDLVGTWSGALDFGRFQFEMRFKVTPSADGKQVKVTMDMPGNGPRDMPCRAILLNPPDVRIEIDRPAAVVSGRIDEKLTIITGNFESDDFPFGNPTTLVLKRSTESEKPEPAPTYTFSAGEAMDPRGYWIGEWDGMPGTKVRIGLKIGHLPDDSYPALMDAFDFGGQNTSAAISVWKDGALHLQWPVFQTSFDGKLEEGGKKLTGTWTFADNAQKVSFARLSQPATALPSDVSTTPDPNSKTDPRGSWTGPLEGDGPAATLVLRIGRVPDGSFAATMAIQEMQFAEIPAATATCKPDEIRLEWKVQRAVFLGKLSQDGSTLTGTWEQFGPARPVTLHRTPPSTGAKKTP